MYNRDKIDWGQFSILILIFFFWGFVASSLGIIIPFCKSYFHLNQVESQYLGSIFYGSYFLGSFILFIISYILQKDIILLLGYKKSLIIGLLLSAFGSLLLYFFCSDTNIKYYWILIGFFIIGLGFSIQQIIANNIIILLGPQSSSAARLSLSGAINSLGTLIGPLIVSFLLFSEYNAQNEWSIDGIRNLFLFLILLFVISSILFSLFNFQSSTDPTHIDRAYKSMFVIIYIGLSFVIMLASPFLSISLHIPQFYFVLFCFIGIFTSLLLALYLSQKNSLGWGALAYKNVIWGMLSIFVYVGFEVTIDNNLGAILKHKVFGGYETNQIASFISLYWGSLMIGRWTGSIFIFNFRPLFSIIMAIIIPPIIFIFILFIFYVKGYDIHSYYLYSFYIFLFSIIYIVPLRKASQLLMMSSLLACFFLITSLISLNPLLTRYSIIAVGLCCSIMWPCIFTLSLHNLGPLSTQGSLFLIMMILGGAIIPLLQGKIIDLDTTMVTSLLFGRSYTQLSLIIPLLCALFLLWRSFYFLRSEK